MSTNAIKLEAQLYLPGRSFTKETLESTIGKLHDQLEGHLLAKMPNKPRFLKDGIDAWSDWVKAAKDRALWNNWSSDSSYLGDEKSWSCTDILFILSKSGGLQVGLEISCLDSKLATKKADIERQAERLLKKIMCVADTIPLNLLEQSTFVLALELNRQDQMARNWALTEFEEFFSDSLMPAMQEDAKPFCHVVYAPDREQGLAQDWALTSENDEVLVRAHGGAKKFIFERKEFAKANFVFWARQGGVAGQVLPSGRVLIPGSRGVVFATANSTYKATNHRRVIHEQLKKLQSELANNRPHTLERMERGIRNAKESAANINRYTLNTTRALLDLGVLTSSTDTNGFLDYLKEAREQFLYEGERFSPDAERAASEFERTGGLLGWPGLILAVGALTLAAIDTWWGVIGSVTDESWKEQGKPIAFNSACAIAASIIVCSMVLSWLAVREYRLKGLKASRFGGHASVFQRVANPAFMLLFVGAFALMGLAYRSVGNAYDATQASKPSERIVPVEERSNQMASE